MHKSYKQWTLEHILLCEENYYYFMQKVKIEELEEE